MNIKNFFKPTLSKLLIFVFIAVFYLFFASETTCGASLFFSFCYKAHGFPFSYFMTGDVDWLDKTPNALFLGKYFGKSGNALFNAPALAIDILLIYLLSCFLGLFINVKKLKRDSNKKIKSWFCRLFLCLFFWLFPEESQLHTWTLALTCKKWTAWNLLSGQQQFCSCREIQHLLDKRQKSCANLFFSRCQIWKLRLHLIFLKTSAQWTLTGNRSIILHCCLWRNSLLCLLSAV